MEQRQLITTARVTGVWYLTLAIFGVLGFMIFHPQVFVSDDPQKTLSNLTRLDSTSRIRLLLELIIIVSQALTAVWFYKLFHQINSWAAWTIGIWGMMNSAAIMISAISMSSAIEIANSSTQSYQEKIVLIQLLNSFIANAWGVGSLFFGLWLIPMGYIIINSKRMPVWLGRILIIGGIGYLLSAFIKYMGIENTLLDLLVIPATIGEFWMIAYLLIYGIRPSNE
ncbi:MAG: DUF4386 domain-containing protein [Flavitalea sp.]